MRNTQLGNRELGQIGRGRGQGCQREARSAGIPGYGPRSGGRAKSIYIQYLTGFAAPESEPTVLVSCLGNSLKFIFLRGPILYWSKYWCIGLAYSFLPRHADTHDDITIPSKPKRLTNTSLSDSMNYESIITRPVQHFDKRFYCSTVAHFLSARHDAHLCRNGGTCGESPRIPSGPERTPLAGPGN